MKRAIRKKRPLKRLHLLIGPTLMLVWYLVVFSMKMPETIELAAGVLTIIRITLALFVQYALAPLLVMLLLMRIFRVHRGVSQVTCFTYIDGKLFHEFSTQPSDVDPDDVSYWEVQENISDRKEKEGSGYSIARSGATIFRNAWDSPEKEDLSMSSGKAFEDTPDGRLRKGKNLPDAADPLAELPAYDPDGPDPFK